MVQTKKTGRVHTTMYKPQPSIRVSMTYLHTPEAPDRVTLSLIGRRYTPEQKVAMDERMEAASLHLLPYAASTSRLYARARKVTTQTDRAEAYLQSIMYKLFDLPDLQWVAYSTIKTRTTPTYTLSHGTVFYRPDKPAGVHKGLRFTMR